MEITRRHSPVRLIGIAVLLTCGLGVGTALPARAADARTSEARQTDAPCLPRLDGGDGDSGRTGLLDDAWCQPGDDPDPDSDAEADTGSDGDADSDGEAGSESDPGPDTNADTRPTRRPTPPTPTPMRTRTPTGGPGGARTATRTPTPAAGPTAGPTGTRTRCPTTSPAAGPTASRHSASTCPSTTSRSSRRSSAPARSSTPTSSPPTGTPTTARADSASERDGAGDGSADDARGDDNGDDNGADSDESGDSADERAGDTAPPLVDAASDGNGPADGGAVTRDSGAGSGIAAAVLPGVGDAIEQSAATGLDWTGALAPGPDAPAGGRGQQNAPPDALPHAVPAPAVPVPTVAPEPAPGRVALDRSVAATAFADALPSPGEVRWDVGSVLRSLLLTLVLVVLLALPVGIVNSAAEAHAGRLAALRARLRIAAVAAWSARVPAAATVAGGAVVYGFVEPAFGFDLSSLALVLGMAVAFGVVSLAKEASKLLYVGQWWGISGHLAVVPGFLVVAVVCVTLSRVVGLESGLLLGTLLAFSTGRALRSDEEGPALAVAAASLTAVGLLAWVLRDPFVAAAGPAGSFVPEVVGAALSAITVASLANLVWALVPIALDGAALLRWSRPAWAFFAVLGGFAFVHVVLHPPAGTGSFVGRDAFLAVLIGAYLLGALGFCAWLRGASTQQRVTT